MSVVKIRGGGLREFWTSKSHDLWFSEGILNYAPHNFSFYSERSLRLLYDGLSYERKTKSGYGACSIQAHAPRDCRKEVDSAIRFQVSTARRVITRQPRYCFSDGTEGYFYTRLLLASTSLRERSKAAEIKDSILDGKAGIKQTKGCSKPTESKSARVALHRRLGVPAEFHRVGAEKNRDFSKLTLKSVELFSGAGGLSLGVTRAGFEHCAVVERDKNACETVLSNQRQPQSISKYWPLHHTDVSSFDYGSIRHEIDLLAGGPPCQPFSLGGKHKGVKDERNMFPEMFRAALALEPKAILVENVRGLSRATFAEYYKYILAQFSFPEITRKSSETWREHQKRIQRHAKSRSSHHGLTYRVDHRIVNAADYGIPQRRERVFIVAFRSDIEANWRFPEPTHSLDSLLWDQWITGTYWDRHGISSRNRPCPSERYLPRIKALSEEGFRSNLPPWLTVRDAIHDLPKPSRSLGSGGIANHIHNPGARSYPGHTGSQMDAPAKTLKAGSHGVPGGENMLSHLNGTVRYFTVRECARLQIFPDDYIFPDVWCTAMKQLGNAVPVRLAELMASSVAASLKLNTHKTKQNNLSARTAFIETTSGLQNALAGG